MVDSPSQGPPLSNPPLSDSSSSDSSSSESSNDDYIPSSYTVKKCIVPGTGKDFEELKKRKANSDKMQKKKGDDKSTKKNNATPGKKLKKTYKTSCHTGKKAEKKG